MVAVFSGKVAARIVSSGLAFNGLKPPMLKVTPPSSSLNSSGVLVSCPLSPPYRNLNVLVIDFHSTKPYLLTGFWISSFVFSSFYDCFLVQLCFSLCSTRLVEEL